MTRGEVMAVMAEYIDQLWDQRGWEISLLSKNPVEVYNEQIARQQANENAVQPHELDEHTQSWLKAVGPDG
jgi:hypothetical protein